MPQSSSIHVAIIMDGNGRWAARRGLPRVAGHRAGADAVRRVVEAAPDQGIAALTLYAFSADNWKRPPAEVAALMRLFARHLRTETPRLVERGVRLDVVGDRKSTRLNSSHLGISYAVFCLKKKTRLERLGANPSSPPDSSPVMVQVTH